LFIFFDPIRGWRRVSSRAHRTRIDWAKEVRRLLEDDYPTAETVTLVSDNLNTHDIASLATPTQRTTPRSQLAIHNHRCQNQTEKPVPITRKVTMGRLLHNC
jgi:hypothetical protein